MTHGKPIRVARLAPVLLLGGLLGCDSSDSASRSLVTVGDSAGVRVVTHAAGPFLDTVPLEPVLSIGREGDPDYEFFSVRQVSPLASGNIVVANGGTSELMFFSPDGSFLRRVGREGEGPAEFGFLTTVYTRPGDTLAVMDPRRRRLVYFDSAGAFVRGESFAEDLEAFAQDLEAAGPNGACALPGLMGLLAGARATRGWACWEGGGEAGSRPMRVTLVLQEGERRDTIGAFTWAAMWERPSEPQRERFVLIPFGPVMSWTTGAERAFLSEGADFSVSVYDPAAKLVAVFREAQAAPPVAERDVDAYKAELEADESPHPDDVPFPDRFGAYSTLILSHEGELWARWADRPSDTMARWTVYSPNGETTRRLILPKIEIHAIRDGRIYGVTENELGIQTIVVLEETHR